MKILNVFFAIGLFLILGSIGTQDYYGHELHQVEPDYVFKMLILGVIFCTPKAICILRKGE